MSIFQIVQNNLDYIIWMAALPGGWLIGKVIKSIVIPILKRYAQTTETNFDDFLTTLAEKTIIPIGWITGVVIAYHTAPIFPEYRAELKKGILIFIIGIVTWLSAKMVVAFTNYQIEKLGQEVVKSSIFTKIIQALIYILGLMGALQVLGISVAPALTALGVGGLAVALALQDTLSNLFAGIQLIAGRKIKPGDYVQLSTLEEGYVEDISWRNTVIRALSNHLIIVPNSKLSSSIVRNFVLPDSEISVMVDVGVSFASDLDHVERICKEVATDVLASVEGGVEDFEPIVRFRAFAESSITVRTILRAQEFSLQYGLSSEFIRRLHKRFQQEGIQIPFPIRTIRMEKDQ